MASIETIKLNPGDKWKADLRAGDQVLEKGLDIIVEPNIDSEDKEHVNLLMNGKYRYTLSREPLETTRREGVLVLTEKVEIENE